MQIAYAQTEGYVPVTARAQNSPEYQDYLSRCGEDNSTYYDVKIRASQLLLDHTGETFVTPVFNGSASLRDAAGQLIENTAKSVRRKQEVDDAFIQKLYGDITSLYRLDQNPAQEGGAPGSRHFGRLPRASAILLCTLGAAWILILLYVAADFVKKKKNRK